MVIFKIRRWSFFKCGNLNHSHRHNYNRKLHKGNPHCHRIHVPQKINDIKQNQNTCSHFVLTEISLCFYHCCQCFKNRPQLILHITMIGRLRFSANRMSNYSLPRQSFAILQVCRPGNLSIPFRSTLYF